MKFEYLQRHLEGIVRDADSALQSFSDGLAEDPSHALEWSANVFEQTARRQVAMIVLVRLSEAGGTEKDAIDKIRKVALRAALEHARCPEHSTSGPSNLMGRYRTAAWADLAQKLED
jgi:hypothetical protein